MWLEQANLDKMWWWYTDLTIVYIYHLTSHNSPQALQKPLLESTQLTFVPLKCMEVRVLNLSWPAVSLMDNN